MATFWPLPWKAPADHARHVRHRGFALQDRFRLLDHRERARLRGARRQLHHHLKLRLVFLRQEAARHLQYSTPHAPASTRYTASIGPARRSARATSPR